MIHPNHKVPTTGQLVEERKARHADEIFMIRSVQDRFIKNSLERLGIERVLDYLEGFQEGNKVRRNKVLKITKNTTNREQLRLEKSFSIDKAKVMKVVRAAYEKLLNSSDDSDEEEGGGTYNAVYSGRDPAGPPITQS
ncbi:hypothetical protein COB57_04435 [Candidatus Peregrinibacteria bacterium]|nr:MAG: hypothetical protein COB57_04435 [Candidatus Peregrinibacteria bacterium]